MSHKQFLRISRLIIAALLGLAVVVSFTVPSEGAMLMLLQVMAIVLALWIANAFKE